MEGGLKTASGEATSHGRGGDWRGGIGSGECGSGSERGVEVREVQSPKMLTEPNADAILLCPGNPHLRPTLFSSPQCIYRRSAPSTAP